MAGNVFRRFLEIVLDKASAKKTERDTQESLDKATDSRRASANLGRIGQALNSLARLFVQATGAVVGYGLAIARLTERGGQFLNVQRAFTRAVGDADAALSRLRTATNGLISDYDLMVGFNKALSLGAVKTIEQFGEMASVARDLGRALGVDAAFAMEKLSLGIARRSPKILDDIGITAKATDDFATIMQKARERVDQFGVSGTNTADMLQRLVTMFTNAKDAVSKFLAQSDALRIAFFEAGNVLETITDAINSGDRGHMVEAFRVAGELAGVTFAQAVLRGISDTIKKARESTGIAAQAAIVLGLLWATGGAFGLAGMSVGVGLGFSGAIGGVLGVGALAGKAAGSADNTVNALLEEASALDRLLKSEAELRRKRNPPAPPITPPGAAPSTAITPNAGFLAQAEEFRNRARSLLGMPAKPLFRAPEGSITGHQAEQFAALVDKYRTGFADIESAGQTAALGIEDAFSRALGQIGQEGTSVGSILATVFRGIAAAGLNAIAQYATGKVTEDIAHAFDEFAAATASAASFNLPGAALHTQAAHGYLIGAAKWALAGGIAGAAGAGVGGAGGSSFRGSDVTGRAIDKLDRGGPEIHIHIDGVDPTNPRHQRAIGETIREYEKRYGGRITVDQ